MQSAEQKIERNLDELFIKSKKSKWSVLVMYFYIYRYKLKSTRDQILKITLWTSILVMILSASYSVLPFSFVETYRLYTNQITVIAIGFATSLLAATFIEVFERIRKEHRKYFSSYNLRKLFGCSSDKDRVVISLSKFRMSRQKENEGLFREGNDKDLIEDGNSPEDDPHYFSNIAYSDAIGAANIASMFTNNDLCLPKIFLDMEIIGAIFNDNSIQVDGKRDFASYPFDTYTIIKRTQDQKNLKSALKFKKLETIICIGLYSNEITMWLNSRSDKNLFEIIGRDIESNPIGKFKVRERIEKRNIDYKSWDSTEYVGKVVNDKGEEYTDQFALIARIIVGNINFILIGGQTAIATKEISRHFYKNWDKIAHKVSIEQDKSLSKSTSVVKSKSFAYIFEIKPKKGSVNRDIYPKCLVFED